MNNQDEPKRPVIDLIKPRGGWEWSGLAAFVVVAGLLLIPISNMYRESMAVAQETLTLRVMDSIVPFQIRYQEQHGTYASGRYEPLLSQIDIAEKTGWTPSTDDGTSYRVELVGHDQYTVIAVTPQGDTYCRRYPAKIDC